MPTRPMLRRLAPGLIAGVAPGLCHPLMWGVVALGSGLAVPGQTLAQTAGEPSGRGFDGQRLRAPTVAGVIRFHATRASVWSEAGSPPTRRLVLEDHVLVVFGDAVFEARRAVVWLQSLEPVGATGGEYQVFVVFEDVGSAAAAATPAVSARWLPVQGIIRTEDRPELRADAVVQGRPGGDGLRGAEGEFANHLRRLRGLPEVAGLAPEFEDDPRIWRPVAAPRLSPVARPPLTPRSPGVDEGGERVVIAPEAAESPAAPRPWPGEAVVGPWAGSRAETEVEATARFREAARALPPVAPTPVVAPVVGLVTLDVGGTLEVREGAEETLLIADGGVVIQSTDAVTGRTLLLRADRAVVFMEGGPLAEMGRLDRERFRGVYLEGAVMGTDGQYTLRGQSVYYDVRADRALALDAVFSTYDERMRVPLYMRAAAIRQEAAGEFSAERPRLATSAFFRPLLTLGASSVTLRRVPGSDGRTRNVVDADHIALRAGELPFFYWPTFSGEPERFPLRGIAVVNPGGKDGVLRTEWDLLSLTGFDGPRDLGAELEASLLLDWYFQRGVAGGVSSAWTTERSEGSLLAYGIWDDEGEDRTHSGARIGRDGDNRGLVLAEHRWRFSDLWTVTGEFSYIGDETFVDAFFDSSGETRREFATGIAAQRLESNTALTIQARGSLNDFSANEYILAGPGYTTERLPEFRYVRLADDMFPAAHPGLLSYSLDARAGYLRMSFTEPTAAELGFRNRGRSLAGLGVEPNQSIADRLRSEGYFEAGVWRLDARHELSSKIALGPVTVTPWVVGRTTLYDNDFEEHSGGGVDKLRLWGAAGVTAATSVQRVYDGVESRLLDLHRVRHIIEPSVTVFHAGSTVDSVDLPIYDDDVEGLSEGTTVRVGLAQTFQTQRGGPGQWRGVDFLTVDIELIWNDDAQDRESLLARFYEPRPELSSPGTFGRLDAAWHLTESLGLTTEWIYDLDASQPARTSVGYLARHSPQMTSSGEIRFLNPQNVTYADLGVQYALTEKYAVTGSMSFDLEEGDFRRARIGLRRELPGFFIRFDFLYDNVRGETSLGFTVLPAGTPAVARDLD